MKSPSSPTSSTTSSSSGSAEENDSNSASKQSTNKQRQKQTQPTVHWILVVLRTLLLDLPLLVAVFGVAASILVQSIYEGPILDLVDTYRRDGAADAMGFFPELDPDMTYYNRDCGVDDISTTDANDLLVPQNATAEEAAEIMMTHGAVVIQDLLSQETAMELREYLEGRHAIQSQLPWHEKFWEAIGRLSLGLGVVDHPIVGRALQEVGTHTTLTNTLEGIVGPDPAIVEVSTLSAMYGCEPQGLHTDSDYFGSSLLYSRSFLHSYTMFMALQDTTSRMGATTVCPGTHWCANEDLEDVCMKNGAFEASSNGLTGKDAGVLHRGSGMMFNQNIWHRGPMNKDDDFPMNRVMFILTFVSRRELERGDLRQQGLGTYYYMRWNMWGHTFNDLKNAAMSMSQPWAGLRALGMYKPKNAKWGILWWDHAARQLANREDFFADYELPDFQQFLKVNQYPANLTPDREHSHRWEPFLIQLFQKARGFLESAHWVAVAAYLVTSILLALLTPLIRGPQPRRFHFLLRFIVIHAIVMGLTYGFWLHVQRSFLATRIQTRQVHNVPVVHTADDGHLELTTTPERMDVLVGSRFDAEFLSSFDNVLDYHPGNKRFDQMLSSISDESLALAFMQQPLEGVVPRFLQQDWQTGYWTVMSESDKRTVIHQEMQGNAVPLKRKLHSRLKQGLAASRFGTYPDQVAKHFMGSFVQQWESVLWGSAQSATGAHMPVTSSSKNENRKLYMKKTLEAPMTVKKNLRGNAMVRSSDVIQIGNRVSVFYGNEYATGVLLAVDGSQASIAYHDGSVEVVPIRRVTRYHPIVQGDTVQVIGEHGVSEAVVTLVTPLRTYNIKDPDADDVSYDDLSSSLLQVLSTEVFPGVDPSDESADPEPQHRWPVGTRVYALYEGNEWFPGAIAVTNRDGSYGINYDDGDFEDNVGERMIHVPES